MQDIRTIDEVSRFGTGQPEWPPNSEGRYTVQFQLSCGYVIVNPAGIESTLGYQNKQQAECVAESLTEGHAIGKAEARTTIETLSTENTRLSEKVKVLEGALKEITEQTDDIVALDLAEEALTNPEGGSTP